MQFDFKGWKENKREKRSVKGESREWELMKKRKEMRGSERDRQQGTEQRIAAGFL